MVATSVVICGTVAARFPFPSFPRGWYVVAFSTDLAPGEVRTLHYFDRDLVAYRSEAGVVSVLDKTCPHLGAHLGGGTVDGECLRCPFHAWKFAGDGHCVEVPYAAKIPPRARVRAWPVLEQNGTILVHYDATTEATTGADADADARRPEPLPPLEERGWTPNRTVRWEIRSHPQEVGENTVDCAHLGPIHHVTSTKVRSVEQDGDRMRVVLDLVASGQAVGMPDETNEVELDVTLRGLGVIISNTHVITAGLRTRQRIHPTPIDRERIAIFALGNTLEMPDPEYTREIDVLFWDAFLADFPRDFPIWENKAYLDRPLLAGGDGPIGAYRKWARRLYTTPVGAAPTLTDAPRMVRIEPAPAIDRVRRVLARSRLVFEQIRRELVPVVVARRSTKGTATPERDDDAPPVADAKAPSPTPPKADGPRFASVDVYFDTLERRFDPEAAGDLDAVFQWRLEGPGAREQYARVRRGTIETAVGVHDSPTVTIEMSSDDYLQMINGELNGALAFSTGRGRLRGPVRLAMKMQRLFPLERTLSP